MNNENSIEGFKVNLEMDMSRSDPNSMDHAENFVIKMLNKKRNGYYVELGAYHSQQGSNTYRLEKDYDWKGVSFEINPPWHAEIVKNRKNECILGDATKFNYTKYFEENNFPKQIDFLQIDIDLGYTESGRPFREDPSLLGLIAIPLNTYRFSVITFEHDVLSNYKQTSMRDAAREILYSLGYSLVVRLPHEDWWVDSTVIPYKQYMHHLRMNAQ